MTEAKKSSGRGWMIGLVVVGLIGANAYWNHVDPVADHAAHAAPAEAEAEAAEAAPHGAEPAAKPAEEVHEHWSLFSQFLPQTFFDNMSAMLAPTWLFNQPKVLVSHVIMAILSLLVGLGLALSARRRFRAGTDEERLLPQKEWSALALFDVVIEMLLNLMESLMPREMALRALPLVTAFAFFIFISNFMGLVPGFLPATDNLNTTMALALVSFAYYNYWGIRKQGVVNYLKHFMGPSIWLAPLMLPVEIISHIARPVSLAVRLMGNMFGDHLVLGIFLSFHLIFVPLPLIALGFIVVTVQTAVFTMLAIVYVALAVEVHEHDDDHGHGHAHA